MLDIRSLSRSFGGYQAVADVSTTVREGTIHALIGPNGAGKTTLFNLVSGVLPPTTGDVAFEGQRITGLRPDRIARLGVVRTFQGVRLFGALTVLENVLAGRHLRTRSDLLPMLLRLPGRETRQEAQMRMKAMELLAMVGLAAHADRPAADLALADQRRLEIARALATDPKLLLLDEPVAGMNPVEVDEAAQLIRRIRDTGVTVLLTEHHMSLVMGISDRITVLNYGRKIAEGTAREVRDDPAVVEAYLGAPEEAH